MNAMKVVGLLTVFCITMWSALAMGSNTTTSQVNVGVVLDADTWIGKLGLSCIHMALSDFYALHSHYKTRIVLYVKHSNSHMITAASAALDLIKNVEVQAIIGPQYSRQAGFVIEVGNKTEVPIISFSTTSPSLNDPPSPYFFPVAQSDTAQVAAIAAIVEDFEWTQAVPIYEEGLYGEEVIPSMIKALQDANVRVPNQTAISPSATDQQIVEELNNLRMISNRVFIVHMPPILGLRVFTKARDMGMMSQGYVWIVTTTLTNLLDWTNSSVTDSLQGVLGVATYFHKSKEQQDFEVRWKLKFQQEYPDIIGAQLNVFGLWAYDAATALAMAVERAGVTHHLSFQKTNASKSNNTTDFETLGVSQSGSKLREALSKSTFQGLAGELSLVNGEVNSKTFQIVNVIGDGKKVVGFWTPQNGLERKLSHKNGSTYSASKANLGQIIWPGDSSSAPKGWEVAAYGKKLKVGVPVIQKVGLFVRVQYDSGGKIPTFSGYSIDIFIEAMRSLPYPVPYEFIPFRPDYDHDHFGAGIFYDDLIQKVYHGEIDALVGDITISFKRSQYVDFTLPFTESGATFIVPTKEKNKTKAWLFLKPLTWKLWLTTGCFFIFIGFVAWVLEHGINEEFRGSPSQQVGTSFWFSFSTMVFAPRENVHSNLARVVVIIWVFVVLILTQSYTASFTTLLTVQQLRPTVTDVNQLLQSGHPVGYHFGSGTYDILKQMGFVESRLQPYHSPEEFDQLLTIGSQDGGIAAGFDEIPYLKLMLVKYCSKYTTMGPTYQIPGFGIAFRRNSPLATELSRAILNLTDQGMMKLIEQKWFGNESRCTQPSAVDATYSLDLDSFRGLFLVAGVASSFALFIHLAVFLVKNRQLLRRFDPQDSIIKRIWVMLKVFCNIEPTFPGSGNDSHHVSEATVKIGDGTNVVQASSLPRHLNQISPTRLPDPIPEGLRHPTRNIKAAIIHKSFSH